MVTIHWSYGTPAGEVTGHNPRPVTETAAAMLLESVRRLQPRPGESGPYYPITYWTEPAEAPDGR